ncbi:MAG: DNA-3-methyladenine glycosylase I [Fimbriimonadaceae bacterium]|nr:DNA-3-methyladenine glycosylase I [Fimbriimonadaceae bacterium]
MAFSYCEYTRSEKAHPLHVTYHDTEYGFPSADEPVLFERLILEINQAGLSWETILKKRDGFRQAYVDFDVDKIAAFGDSDIERLLGDAGIIRNRLKVLAAIDNARTVQRLRESHGSFAGWLDAHHPLTKEEWVKVFKKAFRFTGGEIVNEFLMSLGYLPGAHDEDCAVMEQIRKLRPPWMIVAGSK